MQSTASTTEQYLAGLPADRKEIMTELRKTILKNLPKGFQEQMSYGMIGYVVPFSAYPGGYHCDPKLPLPFMNIASQKNHIALYHMGVYAKPDLIKWLENEYPHHSSKKLDIGKSCLRWKKAEDVPLKLIGELVKKMSMKEWIDIYESVIKR